MREELASEGNAVSYVIHTVAHVTIVINRAP